MDWAREEFAELDLGEMVSDRQGFHMHNVGMTDAVFLDQLNKNVKQR